MSAEETISSPTIAGFWKRLIAFAVDVLLLSLVGVALGFLFADQFANLGPWGRIVGFFVAALYFGIMNSRLAGGQTVGKRLCKIKVAASTGEPLSLTMSMLRFVPLGIPWFLNNAQFDETMFQPFWMSTLGIAIFGIGLSIIYLYVFNRATRQSLHDLLVNSYVVRTDAIGPLTAAPLWRVHSAVCAGFIVVAGIAPYFVRELAVSEPFASMLSIVVAVNKEPWVQSAKVTKGKTFSASEDMTRRESSFLNITAYSKDADVANAGRAKQLVRVALAIDNSARDVDQIRVNLVHGYDIGIASTWRSHSYAQAPAEWLVQAGPSE
jgi:uncharacterized RDD family membrane protein YckC